MSSREAIREAFIRTEGTPLRRRPSVFLSHLKEISPGIPPPENPNPVSDFAFAVLNRDASLEQRRLHATRALETTKRQLLTTLSTVGGESVSSIVSRARTISDRVVAETIQQAENFTKNPQFKGLGSELIQVLNPHKASQEDRAVAAYVLFDLFQPYLVDRLLDINVYNPREFEKQYQQIQRDAKLVKHFYYSAAPSIQFAAEGKTDLPIDEVAERLFALGPISAKFIQGLNVPASMTQSEEARWIAQMGRMFQDGIVPPTEKELAEIKNGLPENLSYRDTISSASIAHVLEVETIEGEAFATKVQRPGIKQAITSDVEMYTVLSQILLRYAEEHVKDTPLAPILQRTKHAIPFMLTVFARDLKRELEFTDEMNTQKKAVEVFTRHQGIHIPAIIDRYSDANHITMEILHGKALEELPAHPNYIKNLMVLVLELWRSRGELGFHGDMHDRNIKGTENGDGSLIAYDWAKKVKMGPGFLRNIEQFVAAVIRKNPHAIAKAYSKIQDPEFYQATEEEIVAVVEDMLQTLPDKKSEGKSYSISGSIKGKANRAKLIPIFVAAMGAQHQSTLDSDYKNLLETAVRIANVAGKELEKPEYQDRRYRKKVLRRSFFAAVKEVYFPKRADI